MWDSISTAALPMSIIFIDWLGNLLMNLPKDVLRHAAKTVRSRYWWSILMYKVCIREKTTEEIM